MNEEIGFLRAIQDEPEDDAARLIYADWLDERGDIRAEYLRLEHQLSQLPFRLDQLHTQIDSTWLAAVRRRKEDKATRTWHDLRAVLAELPELEMNNLEWMMWDPHSGSLAGGAWTPILRLRLGIWARNCRRPQIDHRFNGRTELRCEHVTDWALRPVSPGWLHGGPQMEFHDTVDAQVLGALGFPDHNTESIPHADDVFEPPLKLQLLVLERGFVIAERFEIAEVSHAEPGGPEADGPSD